ncbi:insulinase family protein [Anaerococcus hydrogenalis]|uniref:insulinase family protein n=1 Tax=Anaerococcus hydrogenalis TaxID=33029 RepID=UPI00288A4AB6|nr:insulinase family protein [Anaerococcus hydrogenalis]
MEKYILIKNKKYEKLGLDVFLYEHKKSGARINYIKADDKNKTFAIAFKTPPESSKGISHILEHSVLNGSKKYRTKEPFMDMIGSSLQTFLNAMTYPDKTVYPVASENDKDFFNLQDVYLDAVFNPRVLDKEEIFLQEGKSIKIDEDGNFSVSGVVYNEMKGATTNPDTIIINEINKYLYKNSCYQYVSGGNPYDISKLSYGEFLDYYKRFYHPSNAQIFYYGDMDIEKYLENLDVEYLSNYEKKEIVADCRVFENYYKKPIFTKFQSNNEDKNKSYLTYSFLTNKRADIKDQLANAILSIALFNSDSSEISQRIYKEISPESFYARTGYGDISSIQITAQGTSYENLDKFVEIIEEELEKYANHIPKDSLKAAHALFDFSQRDQINSASKGIEYILMHNLDNEIFESLNLIDYINELGDLIETDYFEKQVRKYFLDNKTKLVLVAKPYKDYFKNIEEKIDQDLEDYKNSLSKDQIDDLKKKEERLKTFQEREDSKEDKATIPTLEISDLDLEVEKVPRQVEDDNFKFIYHDLDSAGMIYSELFFDVNHMDLENLKYLCLISDFLGSIDTKKYSYQKLDDLIPINMAGLNFTVQNIKNKEGQINNFIKISFKTTLDRYEKSLGIIKEVMKNTDFSDEKRIKDILKQIKAMFEMNMYDSGHSLALTRSFSHFDKLSYIKDQLNGFGYYEFIKKISKDVEEDFLTFKEKLEDLYKEIFSKNLLINITGSNEDYKILKTYIKKEFSDLDKIEKDKAKIEFNKSYYKEGILSDANVNYVSMGADLKEFSDKKLNLLALSSSIISNPYLHDLIRAKGGAYGAGLMIDKYGNIGTYSYRDPNIEKTVENYKKIPDILENLRLDQNDLKNQKISKMGSYLKPQSIQSKTSLDFLRYLQGFSYKELHDKLFDIKNASLDDIINLKDAYKDILDKNNLTVFGNREKIRENENYFDKIIDLDS